MAEPVCPHPLIAHRFEMPEPPGSWPTTRNVTVTECPDPSCSCEVDHHTQSLPCRWAWRLAHGKTVNGQPFPKRKCPGCAHIRRAGKPAIELPVAK